MKKTRTWVLIADGARARVFYTEGWQSGLEPVLSDENPASTEPTRNLGADKPGRVHDRVDTGRHAMAPRVDWQRFEKAQFAKKMAAILNRAQVDDAFDRLVLVAPAKTLGDLRAALDKQTQAKIAAELGKDLTGLSPHELPKHLEKIMPV